MKAALAEGLNGVTKANQTLRENSKMDEDFKRSLHAYEDMCRGLSDTMKDVNIGVQVILIYLFFFC